MGKRIDWLVTELNIVGGAETFIRQMAPCLHREGWQIKIITLVSGGALVDELRQEDIPVIELGLRHKYNPGAVLRLLKIWQQDPPALLHTHLYHAGILGRMLARRAGISPVIVHQHGPELQRSFLRTRLDRQLAGWATYYVTTCQAVAQILTQREGIAASQVKVIYNGVSLPPSPDSASRPAGWPVPPGHIGLVCVGRLSPEKGQGWLLEALADLKPYGFPVHTVFIGDGEMRPGLLEKSIQLGLQDQITFTGIRHDVRAWLPHFDLFILPSDWEGVSLALLEAMAAKLPVIGTAAGGTPEVVIDGETGLLVRPKDTTSLVKSIQHLLAHPEVRSQMGQAGYQRIIENFTLTQSVGQLIQLYEQTLHEKAK